MGLFFVPDVLDELPETSFQSGLGTECDGSKNFRIKKSGQYCDSRVPRMKLKEIGTQLPRTGFDSNATPNRKKARLAAKSSLHASDRRRLGFP